MCGIVVYYGEAENRLARVLSGMWAIIYRAPDSTGIGLLGNDLEPLKIRRELGSFDPFIDKLIDTPVFEEAERRLTSLFVDDTESSASLVAKQLKLLEFEGYTTSSSASERDYEPLRWSDMIDATAGNQIAPGTAGKACIHERFSIDSPFSLKEIVSHLTGYCDLPLGAAEKLISRAFSAALKARKALIPENISEEDLLAELRHIFHRFAHDEDFSQHLDDPVLRQQRRLLREYVWEYLQGIEIEVPADFTTDGIANLFRHIDGNVLARLDSTPELKERIEEIYATFRGNNRALDSVHWLPLYKLEKLYNVYGIAAAAALTCFQTETYLKYFATPPNQGVPQAGHVPGRTHPLLLKAMIQPVIGQGRWAIQSSISVRNAHPFIDQKRIRAVVLNGMFSSELEAKVQDYITKVADIRLRSENSTELFAMLWGHYFDTITTSRNHHRSIELQHQLGLEEFSISSQAVDYGVFRKLQGKSEQDLDEMAFIRSCETMYGDGGQFAVAGISLVSPNRLYVAAHNRPVYIVKRQDNSDFMVVSDVNAAIGLFSQNLILSVGRKLRKLMEEFSKKSLIVEPDYFDGADVNGDDWFKRQKMNLLAPFRVDIYALNQERVFARIDTEVAGEDVLKNLTIRDFDGKDLPDVQPEQTYLTPITFKKEFGKTFYEEHVHEIPSLFEELLNRYSCRETDALTFDIKNRLLQRRFGKNLAGLNRIIMVGTGTSFLLTEIVEKNMEQFFAGVNLLQATPYEFNNIDTDINPDRDLVVLISWSGTTSDMVDFASRLLAKRILMVGITEKPFSDLALIVRQSGGIIPVFSGEEVTLVATKSAVSTLLVLYLFCLYLSTLQTDKHERSKKTLQTLRKIPQKIEDLLGDKKVADFCQEVSVANQQSTIHYLVDSLHDIGTSRLSAMNLEINSWNSMGMTLDYSDLEDFLARRPRESDFTVVTVTTTTRLAEAIDFMSSLHQAGIRFYAISYTNREVEVIRQYAEKTLLIPKTADYLQPFIDLPFMFLFGFYYGLAHGRLSGQLPRNVTKSITAGRAKKTETTRFSDILAKLNKQNETCAPLASLATEPSLTWVERSTSISEQTYYLELRELCALFHHEHSFSSFFKETQTGDIARTAQLIFTSLAEDGIVIFVPMDRGAEGGCRNIVHSWRQLFNTPMQVEFPEKLRGLSTEDSLLIVVASEPPDPAKLLPIYSFFPDNIIWIGPEFDIEANEIFLESYGKYVFQQQLQFCGHEQVYLGLSVFLLQLLKHRFPKLAGMLGDHFKLLLPALEALLSSTRLHRSIARTMPENRSFRKRLYVTGSRGSCTYFKHLFHRQEGIHLTGEIFGVSAHTHLVLIDSGCDDKFIKIRAREQMLQEYPKKTIKKWEERFLGESTMDEFLSTPDALAPNSSAGPFLFEDAWYLPLIRDDYDPEEDCLVILDATSEDTFDTALDELATFGSRYARLLVISQQAFAADSRIAALKKQPLSELLLLPGIPDGTADGSPLSDYILPLVLNTLANGMFYAHERN